MSESDRERRKIPRRSPFERRESRSQSAKLGRERKPKLLRCPIGSRLAPGTERQASPIATAESDDCTDIASDPSRACWSRSSNRCDCNAVSMLGCQHDYIAVRQIPGCSFRSGSTWRTSIVLAQVIQPAKASISRC